MGLTEKIYEELKWVIEPEFGINIVDLGLVYGIKIDQEKNITVQIAPMTDDAAHRRMVQGIRYAIQSIGGIGTVDVAMVLDTPWHPKMMNETGRKLVIN